MFRFPGFDASADAMYLNFPSNPTAATAPPGVFEDAVRWAERNEAWVLHDFAYGDLVFDGRRPQSFLAVDGARDVGVELFSMSKSYGMAGWRLGFAARKRRARSPDRASYRTTPSPESSARCRRRDRGADRPAGFGRGASGGLRAPPRPRARGALTGLELQSRGHLLRLVPPARRSRRSISLLDEHRVAVAPGEGFGARGAGWRKAFARGQRRPARSRPRAATGRPPP